jgi:hypothetical protein
MANTSESKKEVANNERPSREEMEGSHIWDVIDEIMREVPEAALKRLPTDGAERHDHYLSGTHEKAPLEP